MSSDRDFLKDYFERYRRAFAESEVGDELVGAAERVRRVRTEGRKLFIAGNGGSASIAAHAAVDFTKQAGVRAVSASSDALITAFANDYGYESWLARAVEFYSDPDDLLVLISSSGCSDNILNAAEAGRHMGLDIITFSGFDVDNPLRSMGTIEFWVDSRAYNVVENMHQIWLLAVCDLVIGRAEYGVS